VSYQWQVDDGSGFSDIMNESPYNGANSNLLIIEASAAIEGYTYQCVVSNDCPETDVSGTASISIESLPVPDFTFYNISDTLFVVNNSTGEDTYYWDFGIGEPLEPGAAPYHVYEEGGTYFVTIYAVNDCGTTSVTYPIEVFNTSIFDTQIEAFDFTISPNPTSGLIHLDMSAETYDEALVRMYDIRGQLIQTQYTSNAILILDLSDYAAGTYLLQVAIDGKSFTKKVMKR
jgi:PKD repeat protein